MNGEEEERARRKGREKREKVRGNLSKTTVEFSRYLGLHYCMHLSGQAGGRDLTRTTPLTIIMIKMIGVLLMRVNISKTFLILTNITLW